MLSKAQKSATAPTPCLLANHLFAHAGSNAEYPSPSKAGGFQNCEPLKAAKQGRLRDPNSLRHLYGGTLSPQPELFESLVFFLLIADVVPNHLFIPANR